MEKLNMYPEMIQEIHKSFFDSADFLLNELEKFDKDKFTLKRKSIENLGFVSNPELIPHYNFDGMTISETMSKIDYYKRHFTYNKLILKSDVDRICKKYNLICGPHNYFSGFIPQRNLDEMEKFFQNNLLACDQSKLRLMKIVKVEYGGLPFSRFNRALKTFFKTNNVFLSNRFDGNWDYHFMQRLTKKIEKENKLKPGHSFAFDVVDIRTSKNNIMICAPANDMQEYIQITQTNPKFHSKFIKDIFSDPIVLQPVKWTNDTEAYIIITAWGDESRDPDVVVPEKN